MCLCVCLSIYLPTSLPACLPACLSLCLFAPLSVCLSVCVCVPVSLPMYLCICLTSYLSIYLSNYLSIYLSVYLFTCPPTHLSADRSVYPSFHLVRGQPHNFQAGFTGCSRLLHEWGIGSSVCYFLLRSPREGASAAGLKTPPHTGMPWFILFCTTKTIMW